MGDASYIVYKKEGQKILANFRQVINYIARTRLHVDNIYGESTVKNFDTQDFRDWAKFREINSR